MKRGIVITIDGPAGAGKTTVSRTLATRLKYTYVDTGALYRSVGYAAKQAGCRPDDDAALAQLLQGLSLDMSMPDGQLSICVNGEEVAGKIRTPEMSMMASAVSARPVVREYLLGIQRRMGAVGGVVLEGRDTGSVIFPQADVKFYLDADLSVRAARRYEELPADADQTLEIVQRDMAVRDANDKNRSVAPLVVPDDAVVIDSSTLNSESVVQLMLTHIGERLA